MDLLKKKRKEAIEEEDWTENDEEKGSRAPLFLSSLSGKAIEDESEAKYGETNQKEDALLLKEKAKNKDNNCPRSRNNTQYLKDSCSHFSSIISEWNVNDYA